MPKKLKRGKIVRREGVNLFDAEKYSKILARRPYRPGIHGPRMMKRKGSAYEQQLRAKQQVKLLYGLRERQFRNVVEKAMASKKNSANLLIQLLERRLDNVVYRLGLAVTRSQSRQLVNHRHFTLNGKPVDVPSMAVKKGDLIAIRQNSSKRTYFTTAVQLANERKGKGEGSPMWLHWDSDTLTGKVTGDPDPDAVAALININRVIEFYSR